MILRMFILLLSIAVPILSKYESNQKEKRVSAYQHVNLFEYSDRDDVVMVFLRTSRLDWRATSAYIRARTDCQKTNSSYYYYYYYY